MIDITNEILTKLKGGVTSATVVASNQSNVTSFPRIVIVESSNVIDLDYLDSSGEYISTIAFDINIYTKGNTRMSKAKKLKIEVDDIMSGFYGLNRLFSGEVPNYLDTDIYRYTLKYNGNVTKNKLIYRR